MISAKYWQTTIFAVLAATSSGACAHYPSYGTIPSNPTGSPGTPTPTPTGACQNQPTATRFVAISPSIQVTSDPTFGQLFGYGLVNPTTGAVPSQSSAVTLLPADTLQFVNVDPLGTYSAAGFGTPTFPPVPFTFPTAEQSPVGTTIGKLPWSTGPLAPSVDVGCYSQQFALPQVSGEQTQAILFGDLTHYNSFVESIRGVVVVSNSAPQSRRRHSMKPTASHDGKSRQ